MLLYLDIFWVFLPVKEFLQLHLQQNFTMKMSTVQSTHGIVFYSCTQTISSSLANKKCQTCEDHSNPPGYDRWCASNRRLAFPSKTPSPSEGTVQPHASLLQCLYKTHILTMSPNSTYIYTYICTHRELSKTHTRQIPFGHSETKRTKFSRGDNLHPWEVQAARM